MSDKFIPEDVGDEDDFWYLYKSYKKECRALERKNGFYYRKISELVKENTGLWEQVKELEEKIAIIEKGYFAMPIPDIIPTVLKSECTHEYSRYENTGGVTWFCIKCGHSYTRDS